MTASMTIEDLLRDDEATILDQAGPAVAQLEHYRRDGEAATRRRLEALYRQLADAVRTRDLDALRAHVRRVARERFAEGFELAEVEDAFGMLEEAIRRQARSRLPAGELAWGVGLVGTALAHGRDTLGRAYVSLAPRALAPALDLSALFRGTDSAHGVHFVEDLVFPV